MKKPQVPQEMNQEQVKNILKFIDASQSKAVKNTIFSRLGHECFYARELDAWVEQYRDDVQAFLDRVNVQRASKYWERLEFTEDRTVLVLTGKKVAGCACAFADCSQPPLSLCHYCCKNFQQELFGTLLGQKVEVTITESYLLGDERCSTTIHLV
jgi:predicted ArsR family transcriptional regulator